MPLSSPLSTPSTGTHMAPPRGRGRPKKTHAQVDDGNRRQHLLACAAKLFRRQGFDGTSTRDIALATGMGSGSPFYHFENKQALLFAVMQGGMSSAIARQKAALELLTQNRLAKDKRKPTAKEQLTCLVHQHFEILLGEGNDFVPVMLYEFKSIVPAQREALAELQRAYEAAWIPVLQSLHRAGRLQAPVKLARLLIFGALNWSVQWYRQEAGASISELTAASVALFVHDGN
jgi:AcrR family transcriptional regulator